MWHILIAFVSLLLVPCCPAANNSVAVAVTSGFRQAVPDLSLLKLNLVGAVHSLFLQHNISSLQEKSVPTVFWQDVFSFDRWAHRLRQQLTALEALAKDAQKRFPFLDASVSPSTGIVHGYQHSLQRCGTLWPDCKYLIFLVGPCLLASSSSQ